MKQCRNKWYGTMLLTAFAVCMGILLAPTSASAINGWQYVYGNDQCQDEGRFRVTPVPAWNNLPPGYLSVGWSYIGNNCNRQRTYVIRTDLTGARVWEYTYDVANDGMDDYGHSLVVDPFTQNITVVGTAFRGAAQSNDAYLMQLDCDGNVLWTYTYGGPRDEFGNDVIRSVNGDYVVAGASLTDLCFPFLADFDAWLFRTTAAGVLIWDIQYDEGVQGNEWLWSLTELTSCNTGDILAVGWRDMPGSLMDGYVLRVDGATGTMLVPAPPRGSAAYGGNGNEVFYSVIELTNPVLVNPATGCQDAVVTGETTDNAGNTDIYTVRLLGAAPCIPAAQSVLGDQVVGGVDIDYARSIREIQSGPCVSTCQAALYDLILTGASNKNKPAGDLDAILLSIDPVFLLPAGIGMQYDPNGMNDRNDVGWSLSPILDAAGLYCGAVICGYTDSDPLNIGDPRDLYLLETDCAGLAGSNDCYMEYKPYEMQQLPWVCLNPNLCRINQYFQHGTPKVKRDWGDEVCIKPTTGDFGKGAPELGQLEIGADMLLSPEGALRYYPNPVQRGQALHLEFTPTGEQDITVRVTNTLGELITSVAHDNTGGPVQIPVATGEWNTGSYLVEVSDGLRSATIRIAVIE